jgi:hypothetical protein
LIVAFYFALLVYLYPYILSDIFIADELHLVRGNLPNLYGIL